MVRGPEAHAHGPQNILEMLTFVEKQCLIVKVMEETGEKHSSFYLFQSISMAIQRGNASCVLGTVPRAEGLEEIFEFVTNSISNDGS